MLRTPHCGRQQHAAALGTRLEASSKHGAPRGSGTSSVAESYRVSSRRHAARRARVSAQAASSDNGASSPDYVQEGGFRIEQVRADYQRTHCYSSSATVTCRWSLMPASKRCQFANASDGAKVGRHSRPAARQCRWSPVIMCGLSVYCRHHLAPHRRPCRRRCPSAPS